MVNAEVVEFAFSSERYEVGEDDVSNIVVEIVRGELLSETVVTVVSAAASESRYPAEGWFIKKLAIIIYDSRPLVAMRC